MTGFVGTVLTVQKGRRQFQILKNLVAGKGKEHYNNNKN